MYCALQVPQFLYEAGFTRDQTGANKEKNKYLIGVTEPRRIAAVSMASRVGMPSFFSFVV